MNKYLVAALAASTAVIAFPASAQVTGDVDVIGTVAGRCSVVQPGGSSVSTFSDTIDLDALDDSDGTLRDNLEGSTSGSPADGLSVSTRVVCTSANPTVEVAATRLSNSENAPSGYSNAIDYTAQVVVSVADGADATISYTTSATPASATSQQLGGRIAAGSADNVVVSVYGLAADAGSASVLVAGSYSGEITIDITPTA